jgi:hypothetical protein
MLADKEGSWSVECAPQGFQFLYPDEQTTVSGVQALRPSVI